MSEKTPEQRAVAAETRLMVQKQYVENAERDYWAIHRAFMKYLIEIHSGLSEQTARMMVDDLAAASREER